MSAKHDTFSTRKRDIILFVTNLTCRSFSIITIKVRARITAEQTTFSFNPSIDGSTSTRSRSIFCRFCASSSWRSAFECTFHIFSSRCRKSRKARIQSISHKWEVFFTRFEIALRLMTLQYHQKVSLSGSCRRPVKESSIMSASIIGVM